MNPFSGAGSAISKQMRTLFGLKQRSFEQGKNPEQLSVQITNHLKEYGFNPEIHLTKSSEDATGFAKLCVKNHVGMVIAAGGDGTINAVVNGLASSNVVFGIIPIGTVNLLATELDIPSDIRSACQLLVEGNVRTIDLGMINEHYFASLASVGFHAYVMKKTKPQMKKMLGALAFIFSAMQIITSYPFRSIRIKIDHETGERKGYLLVIGNGKFFSADMPVAPLARMDDHKLDLVLYKRRNLRGIFHTFRRSKPEI
jgi:YegS/Rv2252/BmrU family lipid kinase